MEDVGGSVFSWNNTREKKIFNKKHRTRRSRKDTFNTTKPSYKYIRLGSS